MTAHHNNQDTDRDATPTKFSTSAGQRQRERKPYSAPRLELYGDIRSLTLGGSPGTGDSGGQLLTQPPG